MHHCLLVARLVVAELRHLLQRLADSANIAMAKDAKATGKERLFNAVALYVLVFEKCNDGLGHRHTFCRLFVHICPRIISRCRMSSCFQCHPERSEGSLAEPSADPSLRSG